MGKKKSFNPFLMWGSYLGLIIVPILYVTLIGALACTNCDINYIKVVVEVISLGIVGFLIGWGIHSIFRALNN